MLVAVGAGKYATVFFEGTKSYPVATAKRFEELVVWQMAEAQCVSFQAVAEARGFGVCRSLMEQMDASSGSVRDTIAEGFERLRGLTFAIFSLLREALMPNFAHSYTELESVQESVKTYLIR